MRQLDQLVLFQWSVKIFLGLLFLELRLPLSRQAPEGPKLMTPEYLANLDTLHGILQSVRRPMAFRGSTPFTVLVTRLHALPAPNDFSFHDNLRLLTFSVRSGDVGILVALANGGVNLDGMTRYVRVVGESPLHPIQFDELFARVTYECRRVRTAPRYMWVVPEEETETCEVLTQHGSWVEDWNQEEFLNLLATALARWGLRAEEVIADPTREVSWLWNEDGSVLLLDSEMEPLVTQDGASDN